MVCWPAAQLEAAKRQYSLLHKKEPYHDGSFKFWSKEPTPFTPFHFMDGVRLRMSPIELAPWDQWTTDENASPDKPDDWDESQAD